MKILIVDEFELSFSKGLEALGHGVVKTRFLKEALEKLVDSFDFLALQLGLPFTACDELIRAARLQNPLVKIVLLASAKASLAQFAKEKIKADYLLIQPVHPLPDLFG